MRQAFNRLLNHLFAGNIEGKVIYVLGIVMLVQFSYPITETGNIVLLLLYQTMYASLIFVGIMLARDNPRLVRLLLVFGVIWILAGAIYTFNQDAIWANLFTYTAYIVFQCVVTFLLLQYVFTVKHITRDVLYAAVAIYLLLGAIFVPVYGLVETITFAVSDGSMHAFTGGIATEGEVFAWQDFIYYSYVTLTTLGYGDILPVTMTAKALVSLESIVGVLYLTIIMARLVSLYSADVQQDELE